MDITQHNNNKNTHQHLPNKNWKLLNVRINLIHKGKYVSFQKFVFLLRLKLKLRLGKQFYLIVIQLKGSITKHVAGFVTQTKLSNIFFFSSDYSYNNIKYKTVFLQERSKSGNVVGRVGRNAHSFNSFAKQDFNL